jgi:glycerol-3-phosphate O-acyltransferase
MTQELQDTYINNSGNMQFGKYILEERTKTKELEEENTLTRMIKKLVERDFGKQNLKSLSEKFMIEQYTYKKANANQWKAFEKE